MRVLLVDHDSESLEAIARAIRGVLELDCVTSKGDALLLLRQNPYDVLIACERCVDGSGLDLLGRTTRTAQPLKRIFAAAPERLQLLGPRLAPFKVQRTINYPIDLEELWLAIAQVTGGPNDETDGTIERVVLDERGIPSSGSTPRAPIPPRGPAPLAAVPAPPASTASSGRYAVAAARATQAAQAAQTAAPEPALRAPPPPRQPPPMRATPAPASTSDTGRMRALAPQPASIPPMHVGVGAAPPTSDFPAWTPEQPPARDDDLASISAQARFGVQQKAFDEAAKRKKQRLFMACGAAVAVAAVLVFAIEKFYDPEARAREAAIAATVQQMAEQQKVTDNLTLIEIDIEKAIMDNDLVTARAELAKLVEKSPDHPRREFLQASIDRAAALAKLSPPESATSAEAPQAPQQAAVVPGAGNSSGSRSTTAQRPRPAERTPERIATRTLDSSPPSRSSRDSAPQNPTRTFGAPIGEAPRQATIPLDAPINAVPSTNARNNFGGRTLEASDASNLSRAPNPTPTSSIASAPASGSAAVPMAPAAAPAQRPPDPVDVVPAKIVRRVTPVAPINVRAKTAGYVVVSFNINETGRVSDVAVVESSPKGVFDDAAQTAVRKWIYEPRKENGRAVASEGRARLVFDAAN
ncbi:MAG TPA: TonB family protein [Steroidobacteraceae bacterium]|nr:TonB family protein [Steroidobacteraceae bacterium]